MIQQFLSWVSIQKKIKTLIRKDIYATIFTAVVFTIAKILNQ